MVHGKPGKGHPKAGSGFLGGWGGLGVKGRCYEVTNREEGVERPMGGGGRKLIIVEERAIGGKL